MARNDVVIRRSDLEALVKAALWRAGRPPIAVVRQVAARIEPLYGENLKPWDEARERLAAQGRDELRGVFVGMLDRFDRARNSDRAATPETLRHSKLVTTRDPINYMALTDNQASAARDIRAIVDAVTRGMDLGGKDPSTVIVDGGVGAARGHPVDRMTLDELWLYSCVYGPWARQEGRRPVRTGNAASPRPTALEVALGVLIDRRDLEELAGMHIMRVETVRSAFKQSLHNWHAARETGVRNKSSWMRRHRDAA